MTESPRVTIKNKLRQNNAKAWKYFTHFSIVMTVHQRKQLYRIGIALLTLYRRAYLGKVDRPKSIFGICYGEKQTATNQSSGLFYTQARHPLFFIGWTWKANRDAHDFRCSDGRLQPLKQSET